MLILSAFLSVVGTVMPYEPLHQKYRPQTFADLVGQSAIGDTLSNAIERQRIAPAYLFSGPRGTGKTSSARILAKSLNCINSKQPTAQPCNQCEVCRSIVNGSALDIVEIDAASNTGVDNIREIIDRSSFAPVKCRYKLYVIDECLTGDSLIQTSAGVMRIDNPDLEGKKVLSYNETTQRWEEKKVLRWLNQGVKPTVKIKTTHRELRCTENHLIRTDQGWIKAKNLKAGIKILSPVNVDVEYQFPQWSTNLEKVESVHRVGKESVYDLEVEQNHNFVANGLLVHNCHMLSTAAFNALLKTLEEPPPRVVFVLATTDPQRVIPTIISRCQRFDFQRIPLSAMIAHLRYIAQKEQIEITEEALTVIAQVSHGGLRDAQSLLDQLSLLSGEISLDRVWDLVGAIPEQDLIALLQAIKQENGEQIVTLCRQLLDRGREPIIVLESLAGLYRDLLIAKTAPQRSELVALTASTWEQICKLAQDWEVREILAGQKHLQKSEAQVKQTTQPRLWLEVTLLGLLAVNQPSTETSPLVKTVSLPQTASKDEPKPKPPAKPEQPSPPSEVPKTTAVKSESETTTAPSETPDTANVVQIWTQMLERLPPPTKPLVKDHCSLLAIEGNIAVVGVRNQHLFPFAKKRQKDLEQALTAILKRDITVKLEVKGEQKFQSAASPVSTPEKKTDNPLPPPPQENRKPSPVVEEVKKEPEVTETRSISTPDVSETNQNEETATDSTVDVSDVPETNQNEETETDEKTLKKAAKDLADVFKGEIIEFNQSDG
ncbi:DNA polymerase III, gamma/tau subunit [Dactylococcopsis salina PCC 8305]|uniref:DNA polymerase III subunit gamma/tau n=2 Tax=Dactylococcopsis salina TaxID=292566 RepID=K9YYP7_DACS8|nr:DNA polymerase III, gamma/tau subunit [Dactylococcopsis salina PCC 8305]